MAYLYAIRRDGERAFPFPPGMKGETAWAGWKANGSAPNQLRHTAGTEIRRQFGSEAAQVIFGPSRAHVTQIYPERDLSALSGNCWFASWSIQERGSLGRVRVV